MQALFIRADANTQIGVGHVMRCLALAEAWVERGGSVTFLTSKLSETLMSRLAEIPAKVIQIQCPYPDIQDVEQTLRAVKTQAGAWLVIDGYHFDEGYQKVFASEGIPTLVLDDGALLDRFWPVDILLNQNLGAEAQCYRGASYTKYLLGSSYVLLRKAFRQASVKQTYDIRQVRHLLVTLGGGDPDNQTLKVLQALKLLNDPHLKVRVVLGATNPHFDGLKRICEQLVFDIELIQNAKDMPELMNWAEVAVSAGGSTCWELAFMGVPNTIVVTADNQLKIAEALDSLGVSRNLGWFENVSAKDIAGALSELFMDRAQRTHMFETGRKIVDGLGVHRVIDAMLV